MGDSNARTMLGTRACRWCGAEFEWHPKVRTTYCSNPCRAADQIARKTCPVPWRQCATCERWFVGSKTRRTYCSLDCRPESYYIPTSGLATEAICVECGKPFTYRSTTRPRTVCSIECRRQRLRPSHRTAKARRRARLKGATVERFTTTAILERDAWRCQLCGRPTKRNALVPHPEAPTLDHIVPLSQGGDHTRANVQCAHFLCNVLKGANPQGEQLRLIG